MNENDEEKPKKFIDKWYNQILILLSLILVGAVVLNYAYEENLPEEEVEITIVHQTSPTLGQRLSDNGWQLISSTGCGACTAQKSLFKDVHNLDVWECDINETTYKRCEDMNVIVVPTWYNKNTNHGILGYQNETQLEELIR